MPAEDPLRDRLLAIHDQLPGQLQAAAHWMLQHSNDVALLSMREQAKRAGVPPTTMTRLAQRLGYAGYDDVRALYATHLRRQATAGFSHKAGQLAERRQASGENALSTELIESAAAQVDALREPETLDHIGHAAHAILGARRTYVIGQRAGYPVAYQLAYVCSFAGCDARLLDGPGGIGLDQLRDANDDDVCVAVSVRPYTRATVDTATYAAERGVSVVALTDSPLSPLAGIAAVPVIVGVESPSFFHAMTPALAAAEAIAALVAAGGGDRAQEALSRSEQQFDAFDTLLLPRTRPS